MRPRVVARLEGRLRPEEHAPYHGHTPDDRLAVLAHGHELLDGCLEREGVRRGNAGVGGRQPLCCKESAAKEHDDRRDGERHFRTQAECGCATTSARTRARASASETSLPLPLELRGALINIKTISPRTRDLADNCRMTR